MKGLGSFNAVRNKMQSFLASAYENFEGGAFGLRGHQNAADLLIVFFSMLTGHWKNGYSWQQAARKHAIICKHRRPLRECDLQASSSSSRM